MNKEIEETREMQRQQKLLEAYVDSITQQLRDRKLAYALAVIDPRTGASGGGVGGKTKHLATLMTSVVASVGMALSTGFIGAQRRLREAGLTDETWEDPDQP